MNFNFETTNMLKELESLESSATELLSKKYAIFVMFHGQKWRQMFGPIKTLEIH